MAEKKNTTPTANGSQNGTGLSYADPQTWVRAEGIRSTANVNLPNLLIDEVIGQEEAVDVAKRAARQRRHLLLLGDPGTGKSMIAKAMAEILGQAQLDDVLCYPNLRDDNEPKIKTMPGGEGRKEHRRWKRRAARIGIALRVVEVVLVLALIGGGLYGFKVYKGNVNAAMLLVLCILVAMVFIGVVQQVARLPAKMVPNLLIERAKGVSPVPYIDSTGSHSGGLLGDIRHDPYQSGGLQTATHLRVEAGAIHRAHKGVLFVDEINTLRLDSQQMLLTAMQERKFSITGQSERSSGAIAKTEPVPCDFILVAAGNLDVINPTDRRHQGLHPALRSRIRGYGYEVYVKSVMDDTDDNRRRLVRFIAQEVRRDGRIPHFSGAAVGEVLREAQRRTGHTGKLTLRLRELGGLVRTSGDLAREAGVKEVDVDHVIQAKRISMSLEQQVTRRAIEITTAPEAIHQPPPEPGFAVGGTFVGTGETGEPAGIVAPVEAVITHAGNKQGGHVFLTGALAKQEGLQETLHGFLKRTKGEHATSVDFHVQAFLEQEGVRAETLGCAAALACLSGLQKTALRKDTVVFGDVSVKGRLRGVAAITQMIEGAADLGYTRAIVPDANRNGVLLEGRYRGRIQVAYAKTVEEAFKLATSDWKTKSMAPVVDAANAPVVAAIVPQK